MRQVERLFRAIRQDGAQGAVSKRWGVPSNRLIVQTIREQFAGLVREHYADFGPTLACEYLTSQHGYKGSAETLRGWMIEAQLWKAKRSRVRRVHSPRERRSRLGELVQIDGGPHAWFEDRSVKCCLIAFIDDATGTLLQACFYPVESTNAYQHSLQCYVVAHGRPLALYSDRHSIFTKHDPEDPTPTQFERALGELNIESILAHSPQAKSQAERLYQTLQDRLVKALRLAKISTIEAANTWLPQYLEKHNARFVHPAADSTDAHRVLVGDAQNLLRICAHHYERVLSKALTCKFKRQLLVLIMRPEQPRYALRSETVKIIEHLNDDGTSSVNWLRESSFLKPRSKLTRYSPGCDTAADNQASVTSLPPSCLARQSCRSFDHSGPRGASCAPGDANIASTNATASSIGVTCRKILGLVTSRRKLASTIGYQRKSCACPRCMHRPFEPGARHGMLWMVGARRGDQHVEIRRHRPGLPAGAC